MKKLTVFTMTILLPLAAMASRPVTSTFVNPNRLDIPQRFTTSGETKTLEWGCPVDNERVESETQKAALNRIVNECLEQVSRAAESKPEVAAVIEASVIAPNLAFHQDGNAMEINGTIFLQTVVSLVQSTK